MSSAFTDHLIAPVDSIYVMVTELYTLFLSTIEYFSFLFCKKEDFNYMGQETTTQSRLLFKVLLRTEIFDWNQVFFCQLCLHLFL